MRWRRRRFAKQRQAMRRALVVRRREFYAWFDRAVANGRTIMNNLGRGWS